MIEKSLSNCKKK